MRETLLSRSLNVDIMGRSERNSGLGGREDLWDASYFYTSSTMLFVTNYRRVSSLTAGIC